MSGPEVGKSESPEVGNPIVSGPTGCRVSFSGGAKELRLTSAGWRINRLYGKNGIASILQFEVIKFTCDD